MTPIPAVPTLEEIRETIEHLISCVDDSLATGPARDLLARIPEQGEYRIIKFTRSEAPPFVLPKEEPEQGEIAAPIAGQEIMLEASRRYPDGLPLSKSREKMAFVAGAEWFRSAAAPQPEAGEPCPTCGGSGEQKDVFLPYIEDPRCPDCYGTGRTSPAPAGDAAEITRLQAVIERDRTQVADALADIRKAVSGRAWMRDGRGSYAWDDARYQAEFGGALDEIEEATAKLKRIACDWSDSPRGANAIAEARKSLHPAPAATGEAVDRAAAAYSAAAIKHGGSMAANHLAGIRAALAHAGGADRAGLSQAAQDVLAERKRQIEVEGWTPDHDDKHLPGTMAAAAACYAVHQQDSGIAAHLWPWDWNWWKPKGRRRDLVKAGALILAEIERLDRRALAVEKQAKPTRPEDSQS